MTQLGDELLVAFTDGELSTRQRDAVDRVLTSDPVASQRIKSLKGATKRLANAFEDILADFSDETVLKALERQKRLLDEASRRPEESVQPVLKAQPVSIAQAENKPGASTTTQSKMPSKAHGNNGMLIGILIGFALAALFGAVYYFLQPAATVSTSKPSDPVADLINRNMNTTQVPAAPAPNSKNIRPILEGEWNRAVVHHYSITAQRRVHSNLIADAEKAQVTTRDELNIPSLQMPNFSSQGLTFKGFQILSHQDEKIAEFVFEPENGTPISLYVKPQNGNVPINRHALGDVNGINWAGRGIGYVLVGAQPYWSLMVLSVDIKRQNGIAN